MKDPLEVIGEILKSEMELCDNQILFANTKQDVSKSRGLYIVLSYINSKAISRSTIAVPTDDGMDEELKLAMHHLIQIDAMSADEEARNRKDEILLVLGSIKSRQLQQENEMSIATLPQTMINTSNLENSAILKRFTTTLPVFALARRSKALDTYYDTFEPVEVLTNG